MCCVRTNEIRVTRDEIRVTRDGTRVRGDIILAFTMKRLKLMIISRLLK